MASTSARRSKQPIKRQEGVTRALTSLRKERLNMCRPMKTAIPSFLPYRRGSGLFEIRDWGVWPMTVGRFKAHFGSRVSARRTTLPPAPATALRRNAHHNRNHTSETQAPNGIRSLASPHDK